jgi:hypothetical protein
MLLAMLWWASESFQKIIGDKNFNIWLFPYALLYLLCSPITLLIEHVYGAKIIYNIVQLNEKRALFLNDLKEVESVEDDELEEL